MIQAIMGISRYVEVETMEDEQLPENEGEIPLEGKLQFEWYMRTICQTEFIRRKAAKVLQRSHYELPIDWIIVLFCTIQQVSGK